jgi:hypothetical protein
MTGYWLKTLTGSLVPRFSDFRVRGGNRWIGFYLGLLRGKIRRNKWVVAMVIAIMGLVIGELRLRESRSLETILRRCQDWLVGFWTG